MWTVTHTELAEMQAVAHLPVKFQAQDAGEAVHAMADRWLALGGQQVCRRIRTNRRRVG